MLVFLIVSISPSWSSPQTQAFLGEARQAARGGIQTGEPFGAGRRRTKAGPRPRRRQGKDRTAASTSRRTPREDMNHADKAQSSGFARTLRFSHATLYYCHSIQTLLPFLLDFHFSWLFESGRISKKHSVSNSQSCDTERNNQRDESPAMHREYRCQNRGRTLEGKPAT